MCIRDRGHAGREDAEVGPRILRRLGAAVAGDPDRLAGLQPVSYTHLRAHETVLDLVCRLLLEKQKITENRRK